MKDQQHPVLIIGGGIIGLTLAQALSARSIPYLIYERDPHQSFRGPGWALTIHWALEIFKYLVRPQSSVFARMPEAFVDPEAVRTGDKGHFLFYDARSGEVLWKIPPSERLRLRRSSFRQVLLSGVDVQWQKKFDHMSKNEDGTVMAHFSDGSVSPPGSIVVGCDGARSAVRHMLLPEASTNKQLPLRCLAVTVVFPTAVVRKLRKLDPYFMQMGDKVQNVYVFFAFLDGPSNNTRADKDSYTCQIFMSWPLRSEKDGFGEVPPTAAERLAFMRELSKDWADHFCSIIKAIPDDTEPVTLQLEDWDPQPWDNRDGSVTMAGDSAHAMTMYRGEAFNHGLRDLQLLVQKLEPLYESGSVVDWVGQRKAAIDAYEAEMCQRTHVAVLASRRACLDAHEQERINPNSPLVAMRAMNLEELQDMD